MENNGISEQDLESKDKKIVERSAAYPAITLAEALEFTIKISQNFTASQVINRDDIAAVLKTSAGSIQRDIAAAAQYSLFTKHSKEGYKLSDLFKVIKNSLSERERRKSLVDAFKSPKLNVELIAKFDNHAIPTEFKTHLIRFHKIAEKAAPSAAEIFIESAKYCGVLSDNGILLVTSEYNKLSNANLEYAEIITEPNKHQQYNDSVEQSTEILEIQNSKQEQQVFKQDTVFISEMNNEEKVKIPLSEKKFAYLIYPSNINEKDIAILRKQIELLELVI